MKLVITGASGFVGRQLVPIFERDGTDLLLAGRDPAKLSQMFPGRRVCSYDELETAAIGFDAVLHLAVINNDVVAPESRFSAVNVDFLLDVLAKSRRGGVRRFINVSSTHVLAPNRIDAYSVSKRIVAERLRQENDVVTLYMPLIYGESWAGRLAFLNRLPRPAARRLFLCLATLKPVAHVEQLAAAVRMGPSDREMVLTDGQFANPVYQGAKRVTDVGFALAALVLLWWLFLAMWAAVRIESSGPGIFAQRRVGKWCAQFTCLKFRTMAVGTAEVGTHDVDVAAITPIGRFLRRTKLDELPQVINILRNEVGLVGPRPCLPVQVELIDARRRRGVFEVAPGITGLAQVNGVDMSDPGTLALWDSHYVAMQSVLLDLRIMLATPRRAVDPPAHFIPGWTNPARPDCVPKGAGVGVRSRDACPR